MRLYPGSVETGPVLAGDEVCVIAHDDRVDGDQASTPGSNPETLSAPDYRGPGHIDIKKAVKEARKL